MKIYIICFFVFLFFIVLFKGVLNKGNVVRFRIKIGDVVK